MANFKDTSRYFGKEVKENRNGKLFLPLKNILNLKESSNDTFFTITGDIVRRPDIISFAVYNDPDYWWAIYEYNEIKDPFFDLKAGQTLRIPNLDRLKEAIAEMRINNVN